MSMTILLKIVEWARRDLLKKKNLHTKSFGAMVLGRERNQEDTSHQ